MLNTEINKTAASAETALKGSGKYGQIPFVLWKNVNQMTACSIEKMFDYVVFHRRNVLITSCSIEKMFIYVMLRRTNGKSQSVI